MISINKDRPIMYILAGPNGSGKSTILGLKIPQDVVRYNADEFSKEIAKEKYPDMSDDEIRALVDDNGIKLTGLRKLSNLMRQSIKQRESFSVETTLDVKAYETHIKNAKSNGFEVELLYIGVQSPKINIIRVDIRVTEGKHNVPINRIIDRYDGSFERLSGYIKIVDRAKIYDNSKHGESARLILSIDHTILIKMNKPIPLWVNENVIKVLYPNLYN